MSLILQSQTTSNIIIDGGWSVCDKSIGCSDSGAELFMFFDNGKGMYAINWRNGLDPMPVGEFAYSINGCIITTTEINSKNEEIINVSFIEPVNDSIFKLIDQAKKDTLFLFRI